MARPAKYLRIAHNSRVGVKIGRIHTVITIKLPTKRLLVGLLSKPKGGKK